MAKPCKGIIYGLQRLGFHEIPLKPSHGGSISSSTSGFSNWRHLSSDFSTKPSFPSDIWTRFCSNQFLSKPTSPNGIVSRLLSRNYSSYTLYVNNPIRNSPCGISPSGLSNLRHSSSKTPIGLPSLPSRIIGRRGINENGSRYRFFSTKGFNSGKFDGNIAKSIVGKPLSAVKSTLSRYRGAVGLQTEAFWKRNYLILVGAGAVVLCVALWRIMFGVASTFVGLSEGMAKYGFLALAAAMVAFTGMYIRSRFTINPDKVYRLAMRKLNTSAGILEVMGAPLTGTEVRAYVMSGGEPRLKNFKLRFGGKRCFLIFPIHGSERRGLVSVEAKKKKGQYDMKLLAVDIPMATGPEQRLFLIGDEQEYKIGGGLISELRDPLVKAMAAEKDFEDLDQQEEEEDEVRELEVAERIRKEEEAEREQLELESLRKGGSS